MFSKIKKFIFKYKFLFRRKNKLIYYYTKVLKNYNDINKVNKLKSIYQKKSLEIDFFLPRIIHIETRTKCSGGCEFCLASYKTDPRTDGSMQEETVEKIINELSEVNYNNRLSFYNNNEPFLDKRIYSFIQIARNKLPKAFLELKTNGKGLKIENIERIFNSGLDFLYINDYVNEENFKKNLHSKNILKIIEQLKKMRRFKGKNNEKNKFERIDIGLRFEGAVMNTRAGTAPNRQADYNSNEKIYKSKDWICFRPSEMMTINKEGYIGACSEDLLFSEKMGNINKNNIINIWNSEKFKNTRKELLNGNRQCMSTCKKCDYRGFTQESFLDFGI